MMRKIFPALVAVIAVTATGCTHDDDQSGVPAATTAPSTPSVSASAAVHHPSPAASVSPSRSASPSRATASASRATSVAGASRGHETHGQGSSHPRHVSHARAAQPVPAHSSSRKPVSAHLSSGRVSRFAPGTSVAADVSQQVMVADRTSGTRGTWARYQWRGSAKGWIKVSSSGVGSVFGQGGVVPSGRRRQGTRTTPAGTFGVVSAFGVGNPGTKLSYRTIGPCSWWIEDPSQRDYNRWREDCSHLSTSDNERLADYAGSLYRQAAVLSYNYASPTRHGAGSGAGIFLHYATRYTGGCVAVNSHSELDATLRWLDPAQNPRIVIKA
ncbi:L,D-transpeptidase family protein [Cutibacterium acnes]|uniref:L,D-transpeptidase family protein n=1 Tax=Cutibacterium acnes TaxID=1747 RepID=UPI0021B6508D|nr:L,D-transpeptidase family protein [Cutibacterium acnes]